MVAPLRLDLPCGCRWEYLAKDTAVYGEFELIDPMAEVFCDEHSELNHPWGWPQGSGDICTLEFDEG